MCGLQVFEALHSEGNRGKAGFCRPFDHIYIGQWAGATQVHTLRAAVGDNQAKVEQKTLDGLKVGMTVDNVIDIFKLQHGGSSLARARTRRTGINADVKANPQAAECTGH
ncbi:hypothetical protein D3C79_747170 [compost metagenome]